MSNLQPKTKTSIWVIIGKVGEGKTTLFNGLTNSNKKTGNGFSAVTREPCKGDVQKFGHKYKIWDTVGVGGTDQKDLDEVIKTLSDDCAEALESDGIILCIDGTHRLDQLHIIQDDAFQFLLGNNAKKNILLCITHVDRITADDINKWKTDIELQLNEQFGSFAMQPLFINATDPRDIDIVWNAICQLSSTGKLVDWANRGKYSSCEGKDIRDTMYHELQHHASTTPYWKRLYRNKGIIIGTAVGTAGAVLMKHLLFPSSAKKID